MNIVGASESKCRVANIRLGTRREYLEQSESIKKKICFKKYSNVFSKSKIWALLLYLSIL